mgnify:CR=1 FL=1|tara:strand:+ start:475 stop:1272 length:798 start_codon:yes stop_codon:yes gene_type:complete
MKKELDKFSPPYFIHSDIINAHHIIFSKKRFNKKINICKKHFQFLKDNLGEQNLIFPSFNYKFGSNLKFNLLNDESEVGSLSEWVRLNSGFQRSLTPFFSILTKNEFIKFDEFQNPFGKNSFFNKIFNINGTFLFYGVNFSIFTAIHYLESEFGIVPYRYNKVFKGKIIDKKGFKNCEVTMHVRPRNSNLDYDWDKMQTDLINEGILKVSKDFSNLFFCRSVDIYNFFKFKLSHDIFYMLNKESTQKFSKITNKGINKVLIDDYE